MGKSSEDAERELNEAILSGKAEGTKNLCLAVGSMFVAVGIYVFGIRKAFTSGLQIGVSQAVDEMKSMIDNEIKK